jgi:two-component system phosphate regulon response regulator PhoB
MVEHPGQVFSRQRIITTLKGDDYPVTERAIDVLVLALRRKLDEAAGLPDLIETLRGVGYRLKDIEE